VTAPPRRRGGEPPRGAPHRGRRLVAALALALAAPAGCATLGPALASLRPLPRACAGPLPSVEALGPDFGLQARYRVRSGGRERALLLAAEKRGDRLVLLGLDPLGTHVFTVVQEGESVRREEHLRPLFPFAPENALRDLVQARFGAPIGDDARVEPEGRGVRIVRPSCEWDATVDVVSGTF
jgi:hypothetical protein